MRNLDWPGMKLLRPDSEFDPAAGRRVMNAAATSARETEAFTLVEVMLALAVSAIVLAAIGGVFFSAMRLRERTMAALDEVMPINLALSTMRNDLRGALPPGTALAGPFKDGAVDDVAGTGFGLQFCTTTGQINDRAPWGDVQQVIYELRDGPQPSGRPGKTLVRNVTHNLLATTVVDAQDQILLNNVQRVDFSCFDGMDWRDLWDTTMTDTNLPYAVRIRIQMAGDNSGAAQNRQPLELIVPLVTQSRTNQMASTTTQ
jgi:prepilin-type N-terminal cleavage/methylation domain-containing protein